MKARRLEIDFRGERVDFYYSIVARRFSCPNDFSDGISRCARFSRKATCHENRTGGAAPALAQQPVSAVLEERCAAGCRRRRRRCATRRRRAGRRGATRERGGPFRRSAYQSTESKVKSVLFVFFCSPKSCTSQPTQQLA